MSAATEPTSGTGFQRNEAQLAWLRALPAEVREKLLTPREVGRLLGWAEQCLADPSPETLAEMDAEVYRIAARLEQSAGQEATLRYLRDGMVQALLPCIRRNPRCAEAAERIICRVTDATWKAHADALEATIRRQEQEKLKQELTIAKRIQERLLPRTIPQVRGFDIAGRVLPAAEVGGDYWSCKVYPEDDIVTFKLADVTGHGIAAATLVAAVKFISGGYYRGAKTAAQVMERTNHVLTRETPHEILVTMVYGWLYPSVRQISIVSAGHSPVLHYHAGTFTRIEPTGIALGMVETRYREVRLNMEQDDFLFTCSDGVTEPTGSGTAGEQWVQGQLARVVSGSATEIVDHILQSALRLYPTPKDDMSVLVIKCTE